MIRKIFAVLPALALAAIAVPAVAEDNWYIGGAYHWSDIFDSDNKITDFGTAGLLGAPFPIPGIGSTPAGVNKFKLTYDEGKGGSFVLGYDFAGMMRSELELRSLRNDYAQEGDQSATGEAESAAALLNFWFDFNRGGQVRPYFGVGIGGAQVELESVDDKVLIGQAGVGLAWHMNESFVLDLGYRYFGTDSPTFETQDGTGREFESEYIGQSAMLGVRFNFPGAASKPVDSDGDGVTDDRDQCPGTPPGVPVNAEGCADSDGDGIIDRLDQCPDTPLGTVVTENGCPVEPDGDGDGIADRYDQCPSTPAGQPVMSTGCGVQESVILSGVNFELNKAKLTSAAEEALSEVAASLVKSPGFVVELQGHTDALGSEEYNRELSERRANAVKAYLVGKGVDPAQLIAKGYGELAPIADNSRPEGRAMNRRVEMKVVEKR